MAGLEDLDKALEKAGLDPQGIRDLFIKEAVDEGRVQTLQTPKESELMAVKVLVSDVDHLLAGGVSSVTIKKVLKLLLSYTEIKAAQELDSLFYQSMMDEE